MKNIHCVPKVLLQFKSISFCYISCHGRSINCSFFLKSLETHFCIVTCTKNFVKIIENLPQHLSEKFMGDILSITNIALKN